MKLVFAEYLASLRERRELDVIIPDLLSELGWSVVSRPSIGTRQYGVDAAAIGQLGDGAKSLFLLSIKRGDLRRPEWSSNPQSLRPSLDEIQDFYIPKLIPKRYQDLPVVIVICVGGEIHPSVQGLVDGYIDEKTRGNLSFDIWNSDKLAELLLSGVLREHALPPDSRSNLRKSIALIEEPDASFRYFYSFASEITRTCKRGRPARLTAIRQIHIGLWSVYVWARNADNIETAYLCSERAVLLAWAMIKNHLGGTSKQARQLFESLARLIALHRWIAQDYIASYVEPRASVLHGLTQAVPSSSYLDVNLRLFDLVGRVGLSGLWAQFLFDNPDPRIELEDMQEVEDWIRSAGLTLARMIQNNPVLGTPIKDSQAIDINIACLLLERVGCRQVIRDWIRHIARATIFAFQSHGKYPCIHNEYYKLIHHPQASDGYRKDATAGSLLIPTLAVWTAIVEDTATLDFLSDFASAEFAHSNLQLLFPDSISEEHLYLNSASHGAYLGGMEVKRNPEELLSFVRFECHASNAFASLSAVENGIWPLVILACRHHRVPLPPHLWLDIEPGKNTPDASQ